MEFVYVNIKDNHFKVWGCDLYSNIKTGESNVISYFGRIGVPMQNLRKNNRFFKDYHSAYDYVMSKIKDKNFKGYKSMLNHEYFEHIDYKKPILELIKKIESL